MTNRIGCCVFPKLYLPQESSRRTSHSYDFRVISFEKVFPFSLHALIEPGHASTPLRRADLHAVRGCSSGQNRDAETEDEATANKLRLMVGGGNNRGTKTDDEGANDHAFPTAEPVGEWASKEGAYHTPHGI